MQCSQQQLFSSRSQLSTEPLIVKIGQELKKSVLKHYKQTVVESVSKLHGQLFVSRSKQTNDIEIFSKIYKLNDASFSKQKLSNPR
jgi:hypothetical protein